MRMSLEESRILWWVMACDPRITSWESVMARALKLRFLKFRTVHPMLGSREHFLLLFLVWMSHSNAVLLGNGLCRAGKGWGALKPL